MLVDPIRFDAPGRASHIVHRAPVDAARVARLTLPALLARDDAQAELHTLVLTPDDAFATAVAAHAAAEVGGGTAPIVALTATTRAVRLLHEHVPAAIVMPVDVASGLLARAALPRDHLRAIVIAIPDPRNAALIAAIETVLPELPRDAVRTLLIPVEASSVTALIDHHFFKARRTDEGEVRLRGETRAVRLLTAARGARWDTIRRMLDELDPPSAVIVASDAPAFADAERMLAEWGYAGGATVRAVRSPVDANASMIVLVGLPDASALSAALTQEGSQVIVVASPGDAPSIAALAPGVQVAPLQLDSSAARARAHAATVRGRLREIIESGATSAEHVLLAPLFETSDPADVAAAALAYAMEAARAAPPPPMATPTPAPRTDRGDRRDRGDRSDRGDRGERSGRGERGDRPPARERPSAGGRRDFDRPPRNDDRSPRGAFRGSRARDDARGGRGDARPSFRRDDRRDTRHQDSRGPGPRDGGRGPRAGRPRRD